MKKQTASFITALGALALISGCATGSGGSDKEAATTLVAVADSTPAAPDSTAPTETAPSTTRAAAVAAPSNTPKGTLSWAPCPDEDLEGLQCATLALPLDPEKPEGDTFEMALSKLPATGKATGSILVNPGGPGASGLRYAQSVARSMSPAVLAKYDMIGFDPRGVGKSMPIDCVDDKFLDRYTLTDPTPDTPEEKAEFEEGDLSTACTKKYPDIGVFSTVRVAADMESVRLALGHEKLDYYGASYGSFLGGVYATMYPDKVGHLVLDAAFVPEKDGYTSAIVQQKGFNLAFTNWVKWCDENTKCAFHSDDTLARWNKLVDSMEAKPLKGKGRVAGEGAIQAATFFSLYSKSSWPVFASALAEAEKGNGDGLVSIVDNFLGRESSGKWENLQEANTVINCASGITMSVEDRQEELVAELKAAGPLGRFATTDGLIEPCTVKALPLSYTGDKTIVVVGSKNDPATPYSQSLVLTKQMGPNARLITFTGEGHGGVSASKCSGKAVSEYFANDVAPQEGLSCDPTPIAKSATLSGLTLPSGMEEIEFEDAAAVLGADPETFAVRTVTSDKADGAAVAAALEATMKQQGFTAAGSEALPIEGASVLRFTNDKQELIIALVLSAKSFENKDLQGLQSLAGENKSMIILGVPS